MKTFGLFLVFMTQLGFSPVSLASNFYPNVVTCYALYDVPAFWMQGYPEANPMVIENDRIKIESISEQDTAHTTFLISFTGIGADKVKEALEKPKSFSKNPDRFENLKISIIGCKSILN